jgi:hypothetical protein
MLNLTEYASGMRLIGFGEACARCLSIIFLSIEYQGKILIMQNRYAGDVHDYQKFGLLRILVTSGFQKICVVWKLTMGTL